MLALEVGGQEALDALTTEPLVDEPAALSDVPEDVLERVEEALAVADPVVERVFGIEVRTAVRRLLTDGAAVGPEIYRRKGRTDTIAAAACLVVAQANHLVQPRGPMLVKAVTEHFGLASAPSSRVLSLRHRRHRSPLLVGGDEAEQPALPDLATADRAGGVPRPAACGGGRRPGELTASVGRASAQNF